MADGAKRKTWDLTSLSSLESAAEWVRKGAGAQLVLVVRAEDVAFALDPGIAPKDAEDMVEAAMPEIRAALERTRQAARETAAGRLRETVYEQNLAAASGVRA